MFDMTSIKNEKWKQCTNIECWPWGNYSVFYIPLRNFSLTWGRHSIAGEGLQNLGLCLALRVFEQGGSLSCHMYCDRKGSFSCHTYCDTGPPFFQFHPKDRPMYSPFTTREGKRRTYSHPDPYGLRYESECGIFCILHLSLFLDV